MRKCELVGEGGWHRVKERLVKWSLVNGGRNTVCETLTLERKTNGKQKHLEDNMEGELST